eukprot:scaffold1223_cov151-Amphora_coffeaeformis.AAC.12
MPPAAAPPIVLDTVEKVRKLKHAWETDDLPTVLRTAPSLLEASSVTNEAVQRAVYRIYTDALIHEAQFQKVLQVVGGGQDKNKKLPKSIQESLLTVHVYALYRLERYTEAETMATQALKASSDITTPGEVEALKHVVAQCQYRLGNMAAAREAYEKFVGTTHDDNILMDTQCATNLVASHVANATPFVDPSVSLDEARFQSLLNGSESFPFDLVYNLATHDFLAARDRNKAAERMQQALQHAKEQTADSSTDNQEKELAPIRMNMDWARVVWQGGATDTASIPPMKHLAPSGKLVALINRALDMPKAADGLRLLPTDTSKLTPLQARLLIYNRAILQYKAKQWDECAETCRLLQSSLSKDTKNKNTTTTTTTAPNSKIECLWWEARTTVLQVRAQLEKGGKYNKSTAEQTLRGILQTLQKQAESKVRDDAMAYVLCHLPFILEDDLTLQARVSLLQSLPASWQKKRAVVASLAALYQQQGESSKAMELVQSTGHEDALADLLLSQGQYKQAVELYEAADLTDPLAQARYARALTFCDAPKAVEYWNKVRPAGVLDEGAPVVDGAELETRPVPRLRATASPRRITTAASDVGTNEEGGDIGNSSTKKKKSHESVLRRRSRKREAYLAELDRRGLRHTEHPDPERWLPKYERSYNRRRRNKNAGSHKGAQGGVSDKDAAKLDVAARQDARAAGDTASSTSTAHIAAVSSGGPSRKAKGSRKR